MSATYFEAECFCPFCEWTGYWDSAIREIKLVPYGSDMRGNKIHSEVYIYKCPKCGITVEDILNTNHYDWTF